MCLIGDDDFIFGKVLPFFRARAAAPVAMTTLGLRSCTCARPKEAVVWYTNGEPVYIHKARVGVRPYRHTPTR